MSVTSRSVVTQWLLKLHGDERTGPVEESRRGVRIAGACVRRHHQRDRLLVAEPGARRATSLSRRGLPASSCTETLDCVWPDQLGSRSRCDVVGRRCLDVGNLEIEPGLWALGGCAVASPEVATFLRAITAMPIGERLGASCRHVQQGRSNRPFGDSTDVASGSVRSARPALRPLRDSEESLEVAGDPRVSVPGMWSSSVAALAELGIIGAARYGASTLCVEPSRPGWRRNAGTDHDLLLRQSGRVHERNRRGTDGKEATRA